MAKATATPGGGADVLEQFAGRLDKVAAGASRASTNLGAVFLTLEHGISNLTAGLTRFVEAANPVAVMRFQITLRDLQGVIGRILTPSLERVTLVIRRLADTVNSLSQPVRELLAGLSLGGGLAAAFAGITAAVTLLVRTVGKVPLVVASLVGAFAGVFTQLTGFDRVSALAESVFGKVAGVVEQLAAVAGPPLLKVGESLLKVVAAMVDANMPLVGQFVMLFANVLEVLATVLQILTPVVTALVEVLGMFAQALNHVLNQLREFLGLPQVRTDFKVDRDSSVGAGVRHAQVGDIQSVINRAYTAAFGMGVSLEKKRTDAAVQTANDVAVIKDRLIDYFRNTQVGRVAARAEEEWNSAVDRVRRFWRENFG